MISEDRKYKSEFYKIAGLVLMTPLCRFVLHLIEFGLVGTKSQLLINALVSLLLFVFGIMALQRGYELTTEDEVKI